MSRGTVAVPGGSLVAESKSKAVSAAAKINYSVAMIGAGMTDLPVDVLLIPFYTEVMAVGAAAVGWIALVAGIWDGVIDPFIGQFSDRLRTRWGRRRPFLLFTAIPYGLTFGLLFAPTVANPALWFLILFLLFRLTGSLVLIPHVSLGAEMSEDYDERSSIMGYNRAFFIAGVLLGVFVPTLLLEFLPDDVLQSYRILGLIIGLVVALTVLYTFFTTREDKSHQHIPTIDYKQGLKLIWQNGAFKILTISYLLYHTAQAITVTLLVYFAIYWMKISEATILMAIPIYLGVALIAVPGWVWLSKRVDKNKAFMLSLTVSMLSTASLFLVPEGGIYVIYGIMAFAGVGYGGMMALPPAILADIVDMDELQSRERREGIYYGTWEFIRQVCSNLGRWAPMMGLAMLGYVAGAQVQLPRVVQGIRVMFSFGPAVLYLISATIMASFPLTRKAHQEIRRQLEAVRAQPADLEAAYD
jgi:GPH family glycoside/pentoside/hexuronide:cation symporter